MALKGERTEVQERKLYTGLADLSVVSVNPTKEELMDLLDTENISDAMVNYDNTKEGTPGTRIDFWLKNEEFDILTKASFFIAEGNRSTSGTGKTQFINNVGQTGWGMDPEDAVANLAKWKNMFRDTGIRVAQDGEDRLYDFLVAWSGVDQRAVDSEIKLDSDWEVLCSGDVSELDKYVKAFKGDQVRVLLTVRSEQYQGVYDRVFSKAGSSYNKAYVKSLAAETRDIQYGNSYALTEYIPGAAPTATVSEASFQQLTDLTAGM
jgi:hypothetical protein